MVTFPRDLTDRAEMDGAVVDLAAQTLADVVAQARIVTRVAVTVRTNTFFTRTKIRKLDRAEHRRRGRSRAAALRVLDLFDLDRPVRLLGVRLELAPPDESGPRLWGLRIQNRQFGCRRPTVERRIRPVAVVASRGAAARG